ncbi:MAG: hypothetical protein JKY49_17910 [Cohaesibacteraceae bacterium]|nr:hypothetical protein [Cohaesibacteraceae bacterium]
MNSSGKLESHYSIPFIVDPINFEARREWKIELNAIRSFAAGVFSEICSSFVICHEVGHIACGHIEGLKHFEGPGSLAEMASMSGFKKKSKSNTERRQVWEYDADAVACQLLSNYVSELIDDVKVNKRTAELFGSEENIPETVLALTIVALFAFFSYMRGVRYKLHFNSDHPHPIVRACYIRNMLYTATKERWNINSDILMILVDQWLDDLRDSLEHIDFLDDSAFGEDHMSLIDTHHDRLKSLRKVHGKSCDQWTWISWS